MCPFFSRGAFLGGAIAPPVAALSAFGPAQLLVVEITKTAARFFFLRVCWSILAAFSSRAHHRHVAHPTSVMATTSIIDVKLRVLMVDERNGRHIIKTDFVPDNLAPHVNQVEMRRTTDPQLEIYLFYQPFLGMVNAVEGQEVPFRLDIENWKLYFTPSPEFFLGDTSISITPTQSSVHRLYKLLKKKGEEKLYWSVDLEREKDGAIKKKAKLILLDVNRLCTSSLAFDKEPSQESWPGRELYVTMKLSKLAVALPNRSLFGTMQSRSNSNSSIASNTSSNRASPRSASSTSESIPLNNDNAVFYSDAIGSPHGSKSHLDLSFRLKRNIGAYEDGMFSYGIDTSPYV